jgi:hypothetical protein
VQYAKSSGIILMLNTCHCTLFEMVLSLVNSDAFFFPYTCPTLHTLFSRDPEVLDIGAHEVLPRLFKEKLTNP